MKFDDPVRASDVIGPDSAVTTEVNISDTALVDVKDLIACDTVTVKAVVSSSVIFGAEVGP